MQNFHSFESFQKSHFPTLIQKKVFVFPTETFYALGCLANCNEAVKKIYTLKNRSKNLPLLVLVDSFSMLLQWVKIQSEHQKKVLEQIEEGVATIILKTEKLSKLLNIPQKDNLSQKVGFRITSHPTAKKLISFFKTPLVGTSANLSKEKSASQIKDIPMQLLEKIDFIIDVGKTAGPPASSLLDFCEFPTIKMLREGKYSKKELKKLCDNQKLNLL